MVPDAFDDNGNVAKRRSKTDLYSDIQITDWAFNEHILMCNAAAFHLTLCF